MLLRIFTGIRRTTTPAVKHLLVTQLKCSGMCSWGAEVWRKVGDKLTYFFHYEEESLKLVMQSLLLFWHCYNLKCLISSNSCSITFAENATYIRKRLQWQKWVGVQVYIHNSLFMLVLVYGNSKQLSPSLLSHCFLFSPCRFTITSREVHCWDPGNLCLVLMSTVETVITVTPCKYIF